MGNVDSVRKAGRRYLVVHGIGGMGSSVRKVGRIDGLLGFGFSVVGAPSPRADILVVGRYARSIDHVFRVPECLDLIMPGHQRQPAIAGVSELRLGQ